MCRGLADTRCSCSEWVKEMRLSIETLLHKVEAGHQAVTSVWCSHKKKENYSSSTKESVRRKESFNKLLASKDGVSAFRTFLQMEFSEENLDFWVACEDYRKTRLSSKLPDKAQEIFQRFLQTGALREVNIDHQTRELTRQQVEAATRSCFDEAQEQVRNLMEKDSYPRFLKSSVHRDSKPPSSVRTLKLSFT